MIEVDVPGHYSVDVATPCYTASGNSAIVEDDDCFPRPTFFIPNLFSPNDDVINDVFTITYSSSAQIISMEGTIFDRWGNLVYSSADIPFTWDGHFNDEAMMPGVYVYVIKLRYMTSDGEFDEVFSGDVTLVK